jgi:hypothetical protein
MNNKKLFVVSSVGRSPLSICLCRLAVSAVTTALSSSAQFSIGPNLTSDRISYANNVSQAPYDLGEPAWLFGSSQNPISISYNSVAGIWQRRVSGDGAFSHNQEMDRVDYVKVGAGSPWTDWHETIATPNFVWSNDADDTFYTINGGAPQYTGISYSPDRTTVNIALPTDLPVGARSSCTTKRNTWVPHVSTITPFRLCSINSSMFLSLPAWLCSASERRWPWFPAAANNYFVAGIGKVQQTRRDDGPPATSQCPLSPSERRGGRRLVCGHHHFQNNSQFVSSPLPTGEESKQAARQRRPASNQKQYRCLPVDVSLRPQSSRYRLPFPLSWPSPLP